MPRLLQLLVLLAAAALCLPGPRGATSAAALPGFAWDARVRHDPGPPAGGEPCARSVDLGSNASAPTGHEGGDRGPAHTPSSAGPSTRPVCERGSTRPLRASGLSVAQAFLRVNGSADAHGARA